MNKQFKTVLTMSIAVLLFAAQSQLTSARANRPLDDGAAQDIVETARIKPASVPGRLLVKYRRGVSSSSRNGLMMAAGAREEREIPGVRVHVINLPEGVDQEAYAQELRLRPEVEYAEPDYILYPDSMMTPDDPLYSSQWHLPAISCPAAWGMTTGSSQVTIAVCDTGIDAAHPDLAAKLVPGWNVVNNDSDTSPVHPHGTWTAGAAAASGNNGIGVASPALNCLIMPVRVTNSPDGSAWLSNLAASIIWAADHGARVVNMSYGGISFDTLLGAAKYLTSKGGILVLSSGNTASYIPNRPDSPFVFSVGATDQNDNLASFSTQAGYVDLSAPGVGIWTTAPNDSYQAVSGTSLSAPIVAGAIGLLLSADPTLTPEQIDTLLKPLMIADRPGGTPVGVGGGST